MLDNAKLPSLKDKLNEKSENVEVALEVEPKEVKKSKKSPKK